MVDLTAPMTLWLDTKFPACIFFIWYEESYKSRTNPLAEENVSIPRHMLVNDQQRGPKYFTDHHAVSDYTHLPQTRIQYNYSENRLLSYVGKSSVLIYGFNTAIRTCFTMFP